MKAMQDNPRVLHDPEPQIFFVNIGASTFNYDVRFHVRDLIDRLPATDEILTTIALSFREHNVEMAFNQMDIFVKNMKGQETQLESKQVNLPPATPQDQAPAKDA
jgi:potassium efflux system protein